MSLIKLTDADKLLRTPARLAIALVAVGILLAAQAEALRRPDIRIVPFEDREFAVTTYALCRSDPLSEPFARFLERARNRKAPQSFVPPAAF